MVYSLNQCGLGPAGALLSEKGVGVRSARRRELEGLVWGSASPLTCFITNVLHVFFIMDKTGNYLLHRL